MPPYNQPARLGLRKPFAPDLGESTPTPTLAPPPAHPTHPHPYRYASRRRHPHAMDDSPDAAADLARRRLRTESWIHARKFERCYRPRCLKTARDADFARMCCPKCRYTTYCSDYCRVQDELDHQPACTMRLEWLASLTDTSRVMAEILEPWLELHRADLTTATVHSLNGTVSADALVTLEQSPLVLELRWERADLHDPVGPRAFRLMSAIRERYDKCGSYLSEDEAAKVLALRERAMRALCVAHASMAGCGQLHKPHECERGGWIVGMLVVSVRVGGDDEGRTQWVNHFEPMYFRVDKAGGASLDPNWSTKLRDRLAGKHSPHSDAGTGPFG